MTDDVYRRLAANIEQRRKEGAAREAAMHRAAEAGDWSTLCPADKARCVGVSRFGLTCPAADGCPFSADRAAAGRRDYLRLCGFGPAYQDPDPARLLGRDIQRDSSLDGVIADLEDYWARIGEHIAGNHGMMLMGPPGTGKTFALALTALSARGLGGDVRAVFAPRLFDLMHDKSDLVNVYADAKLLLLDDFGVQYTADWVISRFQSFVEHRWSQRLTTCVTTNLTWDRIETLAGYERFVSRLEQWCGDRMWVVGTKDLRK